MVGGEDEAEDAGTDLGTSMEAEDGDSKASTIIMEVDLGNRSYLIYIGFGLLDEPDLLQMYSSRLKIQSSVKYRGKSRGKQWRWPECGGGLAAAGRPSVAKEAGGEVMVGGEGEMEDASMDQGIFVEAEGGDSKVSSIVEVAFGNRSYPIYIGFGLLDKPNLL
ncbi:hypothetical protein COCNU_scaffold004352G000010 [Cocos nucifera]|nr:hypothetical protein [Cocos nucifera]